MNKYALYSRAGLNREIDALSAQRAELVGQVEWLVMLGNVREAEDLESKIRAISSEIKDLLEEDVSRDVGER